MHLVVELYCGSNDVVLEVGDAFGERLRQIDEVPLQKVAKDLDEGL